MIHLHLDPLGGLAGDMFAACLLAAFPEHAEAVAEATLLAAGTRCRLQPHDDGVLAGQRFLVLDADGCPADAAPHADRADGAERRAQHARGHDHAHDHHGHAHDHLDDWHPQESSYDHPTQSGRTREREHSYRHDHDGDAVHHAHVHEPDDSHGHNHDHHGHAHDHPENAHSQGSSHDHATESGRTHEHEHGHRHDHDGDAIHQAHAHRPDDSHDHDRSHANAHDAASGHGAAGHGPGAHGHRAWREIRAHLQRCGLAAPVREHAIGIFSVLAEAEARVHGKPVEAVSFHEVGAADSISDIVAAAVLIHRIGAASWSVSALPLGSGRVRTAHGPMPVPAPATALLLDGFDCIDDGIGGERVTPTGAAILAYLRRAGLLTRRPSGRLAGGGVGFGSRRLAGISNCVRLLLIDTVAADAAAAQDRPHRTLSVVAFEIDDQSGEDLAAGLDRIRAMPGVHDVVQMMAVGKKGRIATHVQVLAAPDQLHAVTEACFRETTTIGLRTHTVQGQALRRRNVAVRIDGAPVSVKLVRRPDGETGKAEADHALDLATHAARDHRRRQAVLSALAQPPGQAAAELQVTQTGTAE